MSTIIILAFFGIILVGLEVFLPGGILGLVGLGCSVAALVLCFTTESVTEVGGWFSFVLAACVLAVTATALYWLKYFQRTGVGKRFVLDSSVGGSREAKVNMLGQKGEALNDLRPLGRVVIDGKKYDARSEAGLVAKGATVQVMSSTGMELVVREMAETNSSEAEGGD